MTIGYWPAIESMTAKIAIRRLIFIQWSTIIIKKFKSHFPGFNEKYADEVVFAEAKYNLLLREGSSENR